MELVTDLQAESSPILPENLAAAIKFQKDNLSAAVASESGKCCNEVLSTVSVLE